MKTSVYAISVSSYDGDTTPQLQMAIGHEAALEVSKQMAIGHLKYIQAENPSVIFEFQSINEAQTINDVVDFFEDYVTRVYNNPEYTCFRTVMLFQSVEV
jgi:hypothetical protein